MNLQTVPAQVYLEELKATILGEVSTLGETMWGLCGELVTMHKVVVHLHGMQHKCKDSAKVLNAFHTTITAMHKLLMEYKGELLELLKKIK